MLSTSRSASTASTSMPWRLEATSSGASTPWCSSVVVSTWSPGFQSRPDTTTPTPWVVELVSASCSGAAATVAASCPRTRSRSPSRCSKAAMPMRGRSTHSVSSARIASSDARGMGPLVPAFR